MANRALAAKLIKLQKASRAYAQERSLATMTEPHTSKEMARWLAANAPNSESGQVIFKHKQAKPHTDFGPSTLAEFNAREREHNVLVTNVTSKKTSKRFLPNPKFKSVNEFGEAQKPLSAASTGDDWARRNGVVPDVGEWHVLAWKDVQYEERKRQARLDRNDEIERQER